LALFIRRGKPSALKSNDSDKKKKKKKKIIFNKKKKKKIFFVSLKINKKKKWKILEFLRKSVSGKIDFENVTLCLY